jgi:poly(3-hydroxyalkanoate) depolymerase
MKTGFVEINGQSLYYAETGDNTAEEALLVFNGIGANVETAAAFMSHFSTRRVITFDVPGVGRSPTPSLPYRYPNLTRLAAGLLDHLGVARAAIFGVSWGGGLAQQFAHDFPERTDALILAATTAGYVMAPGQARVLAKLASPKRYSDSEMMLRIGPEIYGGLLRENSELLEGHMAAMSHSSPRGYIYQLLAITGWSSWGWLPRIKSRSLILMGVDDPIVPPVNGRILADRLTNAELVEIDCGHLFIVTLPAGTARTVENFLARAA